MNRDDLIANFFENMYRFRRLMTKRETKTTISKKSLTKAQLIIMIHLGQQKFWNIKDLAKCLKMSPSAVTQSVNDLFNNQLIIRQANEKDRREICISLTKKGVKKLNQTRKYFLESMTELLSPLDDKEIEKLISLQEKIISQ
ncbi:MAG TPA: MarR family winged helix-turn-helix transcriptional regulator [bacterium]|nr:MarR family winged helix-turn-helix transcriptional regulator [bacterium]